MKLISVIIPFYNEVEFIGEAVASVLRQDLSEHDVSVEIIIGNDGDVSHREIRAAISKEGGANEVTIVNNEGVKGPGGARNCAIRASSGDYIAFLDADDIWLGGKLSAQMQLIESGVDFVATAYSMSDSAATIYPPDPQGRRINVFRDLGISTSSVLVRADLVRSTMFRDMRFSQDIDLWYRIFENPEVVYGALKIPYVIYYTAGSTKNKFQQGLSVWRVMVINKISLIQRIIFISIYGMRGVKNHILKL